MIEWSDDDGVTHRMTNRHAVKFLAEFFDEYPGGLSEIESCLDFENQRYKLYYV